MYDVTSLCSEFPSPITSTECNVITSLICFTFLLLKETWDYNFLWQTWVSSNVKIQPHWIVCLNIEWHSFAFEKTKSIWNSGLPFYISSFTSGFALPSSKFIYSKIVIWVKEQSCISRAGGPAFFSPCSHNTFALLSCKLGKKRTTRCVGLLFCLIAQGHWSNTPYTLKD